LSSLFNPSWYRVASLKLKLRGHVDVHRQPYAEDLSYLLQDHSKGKIYRFNPSAHDIIGRMDGQRTLHEIWEAATQQSGDGAPTQEDTIALLARLHAADALQGDITPDCLELFRRAQRKRRQSWQRTLASPLSIKLPLVDPERFLTAVLPLAGPLFTPLGFALWVLALVPAIVVAAQHWPMLIADVEKHVYEPWNLLLLVLIYPLVKTAHELGHAVATRKWGGEVHELGISLLVFVPVPYVDASAASVIPSRRRRIIVSAAGMMVELGLAAGALAVWLTVEPGLVRLAALNVMLICGVSTLLFNANPLLRFDGYYILKELIEVPNLAQRSTRQLGYLLQRYLFGVEEAQSPSTRPGERRWLVAYGLLSGPFKLFITFQIILFVASKFFVIGVVIAVWAGVTQWLAPLGKHLWFIAQDRRLQRRRIRAVGVVSLSGIALGGALFLIPIPVTTAAQGIIWLAQDARIRSTVEGKLTRIVATPGRYVRAGEPLAELENATLSTELRVLEAELARQRTVVRVEETINPVQAAIQREALRELEGRVEERQTQLAGLTVRSPIGGVLVIPNVDDLPGRYVRQGEQVGMVVAPDKLTVRTVVTQDEIGRLRNAVLGVAVRLAGQPREARSARVVRGLPAAGAKLPSAALGSAAGGRITVDPADPDGTTPLESVFMYDIALTDGPLPVRIGERAYVRFHHGFLPLGRQWLHGLRQLFLTRLGV